MPSHYFGGAPNAFQGGVQHARADRLQLKRENALNALIERFGPEAADPAALSQLTGVRQSEQLFPHQLGQAQRQTAAQEALVSQHGAIAGDPAAVRVRDGENENLRRAALNAGVFLLSVKQGGGDLGAAFDRVRQILPAVGLPAEQLDSIRDEILADPDKVEELVKMLREGNGAGTRATGAPVAVYDEQGQLRFMQHFSDGTSRIIQDLTPADASHARGRLVQGDTRLGLQERALTRQEMEDLGFSAPPGTQLYWSGEPGRSQIVANLVPGTEQALNQGGKAAERIATARKTIGSLVATVDIATAGTAAIDDVIARIEQSGLYDDPGVFSTVVRGAKSRFVPGSNEWHIKDRLEEIGDRNMLTTLENVDASLMPVSDTDSIALRAAYGQIKSTQDPKILIANLRRIREIYARSSRRAQENATAQQRELERLAEERENLTTPPVAPGGAVPPPPPVLQPIEPLAPDIEEIMRRYEG